MRLVFLWVWVRSGGVVVLCLRDCGVVCRGGVLLRCCSVFRVIGLILVHCPVRACRAVAPCVCVVQSVAVVSAECACCVFVLSWRGCLLLPFNFYRVATTCIIDKSNVASALVFGIAPTCMSPAWWHSSKCIIVPLRVVHAYNSRAMLEVF